VVNGMIEDSRTRTTYAYVDANLNCSHSYLLPAMDAILRELRLLPQACRLFDLGCGNGSVAAHFADMGYAVTGIDSSEEGVRQANKHNPDINIQQGSVYDDLFTRFGQFPVVVSLEVVEHLYAPRQFAETIYQLVEPGGAAIISTPYHGYLKNAAIALTGQTDRHFDPLRDGGHIKFWSIATLRQLLEEAGFQRITFRRVGRIPLLAKSLIAITRKPAAC
jgi:2-polyprenyl-3-methyl-5-hydroxy-6-metoxy-1,4-benzoquinol methylase